MMALVSFNSFSCERVIGVVCAVSTSCSRDTLAVCAIDLLE